MSTEGNQKRPRTIASSQLEPATVERGTTALPTSRVNRIIKADEDVNLCSKEAIFLIAKATERMVQTMTAQAHANGRLEKRTKMVKYSDLAATASNPQWFYLGEVIPAPISLQAAKLLRQQNEEGNAAGGGATAATTGGGSQKQYGGKRVMKAKKKAQLAANANGDGVGTIVEPEKRKTRGKQLKFTGETAGDEDEDDEEEGEFTSEAGEMDVDD
ncbi:histone-fold domain-containing protein [Sporobolomyces koalae]|uniref:histone-fold domain-containing protein n=1 Tax=Sporobolomyces koalae TaxID=500713 RepID=UPI00317C66A9